MWSIVPPLLLSTLLEMDNQKQYPFQVGSCMVLLISHTTLLLYSTCLAPGVIMLENFTARAEAGGVLFEGSLVSRNISFKMLHLIDTILA